MYNARRASSGERVDLNEARAILLDFYAREIALAPLQIRAASSSRTITVRMIAHSSEVSAHADRSHPHSCVTA